MIDPQNDYFENLEVEIWEDCGHFLHIEKYEEFNEALLSFFTDS